MGKPVRTALITGANRGIGFEVCRQLASQGFVVLLTARDAAKAETAARKPENAGTVEPLDLDVADAASVEKAAKLVADRYGYLDVLVNNAGVNYDTWETAENADIEGTVQETVATNLLGPWRVLKAFLRCCARAGRRGSSTCHRTQDRWRGWKPVRLRIRSPRLA